MAENNRDLLTEDSGHHHHHHHSSGEHHHHHEGSSHHHESGEHRHHHRHHHYLMDVDKMSSSSSHSKKEEKERKVHKKIDLSEKPLAVWLVIFTFCMAVLFLIFTPHNIFISTTHTITKWSAVAVCFSFTSMGTVLYQMRDKLSSSKTSNNVKNAIKGATMAVASSGLVILLAFAVINMTIVSQGIANPDDGYMTRGQLEAFLDEYNMKASSTETDRITLTMPEEVNLAPEALNAVITDGSGRITDDIVEAFRSGTRMDMGYPANITFTIEEGLASNLAYITVEVSETEDLQNARVFTLEPTDRSVEIYHLKTGTKYYYRVNAFLSDGGDMNVRNRSGSFTTAYTPRFLYIEGAKNFRDIGGWMKTEDGREIKQNMLIRGTEIDALVQPEYKATEKGIADLKEQFAIKSDFDLRAYNTSNPLGVNHTCFEIPAYEGIFTEAGKNKVKLLFKELANPVNYPVYMHCTYGTDRTGVKGYILSLVLGVDQEQVTKEYEFSALAIDDITRERLFDVVTVLETFPGKNLQEQAVNYLISCGVTEDDIESIRNILLE